VTNPLFALVLLAGSVVSAPAPFPRDAPLDTLSRAQGPPGGALVATSGAAADTLPMRLAVLDTLPMIARTAVLDPGGVTVDAFRTRWVSDAALHRLVRFAPDGRATGETGTLGSDPGQLRRPGDVVRFGTTRMAVLDRENRRIVSYDLFGHLDGVLADFQSSTLASALGRVDPVALAADRGGALYVADADRDRILALDFAGQLVRTLGGFGAAPGSFRGIAALAVTPRGELVTAERAGARLQRLDASGRPVTSWALPVAPARGALTLAVDDSARVALAVESAGAVIVFDRDGRPLAWRSGVAAPRAVTFAPDGTLLAAESGCGRLLDMRLEPASAAAAPGR
jgi:DNA-binding beta-propeller fold protein YncE